MPVSIVLSNQNIRLVSARKNIPDKWEILSLPAGLVKDGQILDPKSLARIIDSLFTSLDLSRNEVVVSITGISFTYRILVLPGVKASQQREAIERATRKELKVSLDDLYIDWQVFHNTGKEISVFVLGIPRLLIDALVKTMALARVNLVQFDIKSLALSRTVNQADALIVDFEPDWFDIAIVSKGLPVTLHTVAPKSKAASLEDNILQLKDELNRTVDFFNLTHKENPIAPDFPVILTGSPANDPITADLLLERLGRPGRKIALSGKLPANYSLNLYSGNLGLILKNINRGNAVKDGPDSYIDISVDPLNGRKRVLSSPVSLRKIMLYAGVVLAVILIVVLVQLRNQAAAETEKLQTESDRVNRSLRISRLSLDEAVQIESEIDKLKAETLKLQKERELITGRGELSAIFEYTVDNLPHAAYYNQFLSTADELEVEGRVARRSDVIDYANILTKEDIFSEVRIASIEEDPGNAENADGLIYHFRIVIKR
jgi:hypothetical protein